jgi:hypothetical protein
MLGSMQLVSDRRSNYRSRGTLPRPKASMRALESRCAWLCLGRTAPRACSRAGKTKRSRGDVASRPKRLSIPLCSYAPMLEHPLELRSLGHVLRGRRGHASPVLRLYLLFEQRSPHRPWLLPGSSSSTAAFIALLKRPGIIWRSPARRTIFKLSGGNLSIIGKNTTVP